MTKKDALTHSIEGLFERATRHPVSSATSCCATERRAGCFKVIVRSFLVCPFLFGKKLCALVFEFVLVDI